MLITHALSVQEPYAWLMVDGFKTNENRSRAFPGTHELPKWIAIHASTNSLAGDYDLIEDICSLSKTLDTILDDKKWDDDKNWLFCYAEIIGAVKVVDSIWVAEKDCEESIENAGRWGDIVRESTDKGRPFESDVDPMSWFSPGTHHWVLADRVRFRTTIRCRGRLGVWPMPPELQRMVHQSMKERPLGRGESYEKTVEFEKVAGK